jgi:pimeloyl-ACP methyl ester carboxylesterase
VTDSHVTTLADGRELGWLALGPPDGWPILAFHGTPGSRLTLDLGDGLADELGVRLVLCDRPGYGLSTFHAGRRLTDWPHDVRQLADHLGLDRFSVVGWSGGGPHAMACAALLPERVAVAGIVAGVAPLSEPGATDGMVRSNQIITRLARSRSPILRVVARGQMAGLRRFPGRAIDLMARQLPACDAEVLSRPAVRAVFERDAAHTSRDAGRALAQDFELFASDWGFSLRDVAVPVHLWQGDEDRNVPMAHAELQHRAIAGSTLHACPGEGHFLVVDHLREIGGVLAAAR